MAMVISMPIDQPSRCEVDLHRCEQDDYDTAAYQQARYDEIAIKMRSMLVKVDVESSSWPSLR